MIAYSMSRGKNSYNPIQAYRALGVYRSELLLFVRLLCGVVMVEKGQSFTPSPVPKHKVPQ